MSLAPGARVVVVGAGTMGHGIAHVAASAGYRVTLVDTTEDFVERGLSKVRANLQGGIERGKLTEQARDETLGRLRGSTDLEDAAREAELVIEAIPERFDLKTALFERVEAATRPDTVLATNTSSLSVTDLQERLGRPQRMIGLHFFNPVHIMQLVEVVRGLSSGDTVVRAGVDFARSLGRDPILVNDSPGFASSRLGIALGLEAMRMVEEGVASPADIDKAMELGYRHPMGPLKLTDLVGLDVRLDIARYLHDKLGAEHFRPPAILERLVAEGKLGKKSGHGFYDWNAESS